MNIFERTESFCKKARWYDIPLVKGSVFFFTLFLITVWDGFREFIFGFEWYWYLIISIVLVIPLFKKMYSK